MTSIATCMVLAAVVALTGCQGIKVPRSQVTKLLPPVELIQDCKTSEYSTATNAALAGAVQVLRNDIATCNIDKAALRKWAGEPEVKPDATPSF